MLARSGSRISARVVSTATATTTARTFSSFTTQSTASRAPTCSKYARSPSSSAYTSITCHLCSSTTTCTHRLTRQHQLLSRFLHVSSRSFALPEHRILPMPALSPTMEKGNIASWKVAVGDSIKPGKVMAEIETDKATIAFESQEDGFIAAILKQAGATDIPVNAPVAIIVDEESAVAAFKDYKHDEAVGGGSAPAAEPTPASSSSSTPSSSSSPSPAPSSSQSSSAATTPDGRVIASPAAKRVAHEQNLNLSQFTGSGPSGRITAVDIDEQKGGIKAAAPAPAAAAEQRAPAAAPKPAAFTAPPASAAGDFTDTPLTQMRKVIAQRLTQSKQSIPHFYVSVECRMDKLLKLRSELNALPELPSKLSVNDFIVKAAALSLRAVPQVNSSFLEKENVVRRYNYVDVSVAVATDSGLITPIVKDADIRGLAAIASDTKSLAAKAREGKLQPAEFQGGTFTISNLGMFGVKHFTAIINPPQAAILAVGTTDTKVVPTKAADGSNSFTTEQVMTVTLSSDHRVVDGAVAAQWLQAFKKYVEQPNTMLL